MEYEEGQRMVQAQGGASLVGYVRWVVASLLTTPGKSCRRRRRTEVVVVDRAVQALVLVGFGR